MARQPGTGLTVPHAAPLALIATVARPTAVAQATRRRVLPIVLVVPGRHAAGAHVVTWKTPGESALKSAAGVLRLALAFTRTQ
jgi:hypothetical protein